VAELSDVVVGELGFPLIAEGEIDGQQAHDGGWERFLACHHKYIREGQK